MLQQVFPNLFFCTVMISESPNMSSMQRFQINLFHFRWKYDLLIISNMNKYRETKNILLLDARKMFLSKAIWNKKKKKINRMWECSFDQRDHSIIWSVLIQSKQRYTSIIWITTKSHLTGLRAYIEPAVSVCALCTQTLEQMSLCVCTWTLLRLCDMKKRNSE